MFVFGLAIGPVIGLFGGLALFRSGQLSPWLGSAAVVLFLVFLLFAPVISLALKLGLLIGCLLGLLLSISPTAMQTDEG